MALPGHDGGARRRFHLVVLFGHKRRKAYRFMRSQRLAACVRFRLSTDFGNGSPKSEQHPAHSAGDYLLTPDISTAKFSKQLVGSLLVFLVLNQILGVSILAPTDLSGSVIAQRRSQYRLEERCSHGTAHRERGARQSNGKGGAKDHSVNSTL